MKAKSEPVLSPCSMVQMHTRSSQYISCIFSWPERTQPVFVPIQFCPASPWRNTTVSTTLRPQKHLHVQGVPQIMVLSSLTRSGPFALFREPHKHQVEGTIRDLFTSLKFKAQSSPARCQTSCGFTSLSLETFQEPLLGRAYLTTQTCSQKRCGSFYSKSTLAEGR